MIKLTPGLGVPTQHPTSCHPAGGGIFLWGGRVLTPCAMPGYFLLGFAPTGCTKLTGLAFGFLDLTLLEGNAVEGSGGSKTGTGAPPPAQMSVQ